MNKRMDKRLIPLISEQQISATVKQLAQQIDRDYADRTPVLVGVLKGSFVFLADLLRQLRSPVQRVEFLRLSSYGSDTVSSGKVKVLMGLEAGVITDQDVIIVEDIVDTGLSTSTTIELLQVHHPASMRLCALLDKPSRRRVPVQIDYSGITIPDRFIVGYGIDMDEQYRQLPAIYAVEE
jgi:hypoxanthine phosphoribosyltransferase